MLLCPTCNKKLTPGVTPSGTVFLCGACGGRAATYRVLRRTATPEFLGRLDRKSRYAGSGRGRPCPCCGKPMTEVDFGGGGTRALLDLCGRCELVWFDPNEYSLASGQPAASPPPPRPTPPPLPSTRAMRPPERRGRLAATPPELVVTAEGPSPPLRGENAVGLSFPQGAWKWIPAVFGMPVELGANNLSAQPVLTWALAAICTGVFLLLTAGGTLGAVLQGWGFIPAEWDRHGGLTILTSFFLHGGLWHLIGNMYFFLIFGDNVENGLGRGRFLLLLTGAHLAGLMLHGMLDPDGTIPLVGASAGISGVLACYAVLYPRARIGLFLGIITLFRFLRVPAFGALAAYVLLQLLGMPAQINGDSTVSYLGHVGGLTVGLIVGGLVRSWRESGDRP